MFLKYFVLLAFADDILSVFEFILLKEKKIVFDPKRTMVSYRKWMFVYIKTDNFYNNYHLCLIITFIY